MIQQKGQPNKFRLNQTNTLESLKNSAFFPGVNKDNLDSFFDEQRGIKEQKQKPQRKEFTLFSYNQYYEQEVVRRQIKELIELIRKEIQLIKQADKSLLAEVKDIEAISLNEIPAKPGIYHVRFFEILLRILRTVRAKIGESKTWLQAMISKKKKRGSLFAFLSKKKGTQYSLSQELQLTRAVQ